MSGDLAGVVSGFAPTVVQKNLDDKKKLDPTDPRLAVLDRLRHACETKPSLRGALIKDGTLGDKAKRALMLSGFLDSEKQRGLLAQEAETLLKGTAWAEHYPGGVILDRMKISPIRSTYLKRIKKEFAERFVPSDVTKDRDLVGTLLAQTRLDDFYYHVTAEGVLLVAEGVCIAAGHEEKDARALLVEMIGRSAKEYARELKELEFKVDPAKIKFKQPLPEFQKKFTHSLYLNDILFEDAAYSEDGTLHLKGWLGRADADDKRKLFEQHFASHVCVASKFSLAGMREIDWPIDRKKWNLELGHDPETKLNKTHLLRVYFDVSDAKRGPQLQCDAVTFEPKPDVKAIKGELDDRLTRYWHKDWLETYQKYHQAKLQLEVTPRWKIQDDLQRFVHRELGVKQSLISKIWYDPDGVLFVEGIVGSKDHWNTVSKYLETSQWARMSGGRMSLEGFRIEDWPARLRQFQAVLASLPDERYKETRLDSALFGYDAESDILQMRFGGITFHKEFTKEQKEEFQDLLFKECKKWPTVSEQVGIRSDRIVIDDIRKVPAEEMKLQERVKDVPALDGVFLNQKALFNTDGKLVLTGKWNDPNQAKDLKSLIEAHFKAKPFQPEARGIVFEFAEVPVRQLLLDLREWIQEKRVEDTRLDRLYFDSEGKLQLDIPIGSAESKKRVASRLAALIKLLPDKHKKLEIAEAGAVNPRFAFVSFPAWQGGDNDPPLAVAQHLRKNVVVSADPFWDGVLIERGYYRMNGEYRLVGLVDNDKQIDRLKDALDGMAKKPEWRAALGKDWYAPEFRKGLRIMPVRPMVEALGRLIPELADLDRIKLDLRAYHGPDKKLVLEGLSTGENDATMREREKSAAIVFAEYLQAHPEWRERVKASLADPEVDVKEKEKRTPGVDLKLSAVALSVDTAELASNRAYAMLVAELPDYVNQSPTFAYWYSWANVGCVPVLLLHSREQKPAGTTEAKLPPRHIVDQAVRYLDIALFHLPDDTTSWYLRAAYHLAAGDEKSAVRDLRRMNEIELKDPSLRRQRLNAVEGFQGHLRQLTATKGEQSLFFVAEGHRTPSLLELSLLTSK